MQEIRPKNLPSFPALSNFHEINVRAYVVKDEKPGVYFLNIEAQKAISVFIAKAFSGLPYEKASISRTQQGKLFSYASNNNAKDLNMEILYEIDDTPYHNTKLDKWLIERYCLYFNKKDKLYRYEIHHKEWGIKKINLKKIDLHYHIGNLSISEPPDLAHFSEGVNVLAWQRQKV